MGAVGGLLMALMEALVKMLAAAGNFQLSLPQTVQAAAVVADKTAITVSQPGVVPGAVTYQEAVSSQIVMAITRVAKQVLPA